MVLESKWSIPWVFSVVLVIRLVNSLTTKTFFQPDEYYQSLEPAHNLVFGYGYITWDWKANLRSSIHPFIYAIGYWIVSISPYNNREYVLIAPKVINALIAAVGDTYLYIFATKYSNNEKIGKWSLILSIFSPFNWYVITRSFSNTLEMVLTTVALAYWPWRRRDINYSIFISCGLAYISCILRPPTAIIWIVLGLYYTIGLNPFQISQLFLGLGLELAVILGIELFLDYNFYGKFTFPIYNFLEFNFVKNLSIFYGSSPWHFHIFQSVPLILMTYLPLFLHSIYKFQLYYNILGIVCIATIGLFSIIAHKEFRFIYPLTPIFLLFSAYSLRYFIHKYHRTMRYVALICIGLNAAIAYFFSRINERGEIEIIDYLSKKNMDFGLLTPCHSTPWQSHLHNENLHNSWFITCEPPLHLTSPTFETIKQYRDESDQMFDDPYSFVKTHFAPTIEDKGDYKYQWPSQLIIYQSFTEMELILKDKGYKECKRFFNSYFHWDPRRNGDLVIYCRDDTISK